MKPPTTQLRRLALLPVLLLLACGPSEPDHGGTTPPDESPYPDAGAEPYVDGGTEPYVDGGTEPYVDGGTEPYVDGGPKPVVDAGTPDGGPKPVVDAGTPDGGPKPVVDAGTPDGGPKPVFDAGICHVADAGTALGPLAGIPSSCSAALKAKCTPAFTLVMEDMGPNGQLFTSAVPNPAALVQNISQDVCCVLYRNPSEPPASSALKLIIRDSETVASKSGSGSNITVMISSRHLKNISNQGGDVAKEVSGILYHELTHAFQNDNRGSGGAPSGVIEGIADFVRTRAGHVDIQRWKAGGNPFDGYVTTSFFLIWLDNQYPDFVYRLNQQLAPQYAQRWSSKTFEQVTCRQVMPLWFEYQKRLFPTESAGKVFSCGRRAPGLPFGRGAFQISCDADSYVVLGQDGRLGTFRGVDGYRCFSSTAAATDADSLTLQADGNLVLTGPTGVKWSTNTSGNPGAYWVQRDDTSLAVYGSANQQLWSSNTGGCLDIQLCREVSSWSSTSGNCGVNYECPGKTVSAECTPGAGGFSCSCTKGGQVTGTFTVATFCGEDSPTKVAKVRTGCGYPELLLK